MEMVRVLGVGLAGTLLAVILARRSPGYGLLTGVATGCLLLVMLFGRIDVLEAGLRALVSSGGLSSEYLGRVVRILGLACLTEAGARVAKDAGQGNIALKVELCGRVLILCTVLPALRDALGAAQAVLAEIGP